MRATGRVKIYEMAVGGIQLLTLPIGYILLHSGLPPQSVFIAIAILALIALFVRLRVLKTSIPEISIFRILQSVFLPSGMLAGICALLYVGYHNLQLTQTFNPVITIVGSILVVIVLEVGIGMNTKERKFIRRALLKKIM